MTVVLCGNAFAQTIETETVTTDSTEVIVETYPIGEPYQVITNTFWNNWFVTADAGINVFFGDYSGLGEKTLGNLSGRLSPQFNAGVGKWFTPGIGVKIQFGGFRSRGYSAEESRFTYGEPVVSSDGTSYWRSKINWWDLNLNAMFNLSRLFCGYEGIGSDKMMNQFIVSAGIGFVHHWKKNAPMQRNEWSGRLELQYSRFFDKKKAVSLDAKLRGIFYQTDFDALVLHKQWDANLSLNVGVTYYFNKRGWGNTYDVTNIYTGKKEIKRLNEEVNRLRMENERLKNTPVAEPRTEIITFPYLVNFVIDKIDVVNRELVNLKTVADMIKSTPGKKYLVCGYADKYTGSVKRNKWLAEHRARNVFKVLTKDFGVPEEQLEIDHKGGVGNMYYDDPQISRSVIISEIE